MAVRYPSSDQNRMEFLRLAAETDNRFRAGGSAHLNAESAEALTARHAAFVSAATAMAEAETALREARMAARAALPPVQQQLRSAWGWARDQVNWQDAPAILRTYYQLPEQGRNRIPTKRAGWLHRAGKVLEGIANSIAAGHSAPSNHTALSTAHAALAAAVAEVESASYSEMQARAALRTERRLADDLIRDVVAELRMALRKTDPELGRQIMRTYGADVQGNGSHSVEASSERGLSLTEPGAQSSVPAAEPGVTAAESIPTSPPAIVPASPLAQPVTNGVAHD